MSLRGPHKEFRSNYRKVHEELVEQDFEFSRGSIEPENETYEELTNFRKDLSFQEFREVDQIQAEYEKGDSQVRFTYNARETWWIDEYRIESEHPEILEKIEQRV
ncbi:MAG: hypothetical protein ABEJ91_00300 [Candidatus Nanohaloarchaea archaeon]